MDGPAQLLRCARCGRRLLEERPLCPEHGPQALPPTASPPPAPPELPGYTIRGLLGAGGFATVHLASHPGRGEVAIKVALAEVPGAGERLLREAKLLRAVGPPHVPEVHDTGVDERGQPFVVMECVRAPTLAHRLARLHAPMLAEDTSAVARRLVDVVAEVHARGLVHRDLKPENIFLCDGPAHAKLIDFGLALEAPGEAQARAGDRVTTSQAVLGTAEYMAPEQCAARADVDARADVYALGVILYELYTLRPPFLGSSADVRQAHLGRRPAPPSTLAPVPPAIEALLLRCLAKAPEERFADALALRAALARALEAGSPPAAPPEPTPTPAPVRGEVAAATAGAAAGSPGPRPARERRIVGLLFLRSARPLAELEAGVRRSGGLLASTDGDRHVVVVAHQGADNPARWAREAAERLSADGLIDAAVVDADSVNVITVAGAEPRFFSRAFTQAESFPAAEARGLTLSARAAALLPAAEAADSPMLGRDDELQALVDTAFDATERGEPTLATVIGEPGLGKSRLCAALLADLPQMVPAARLLHLRAREPFGGDAGRSLRELAALALDPPASLERERGRELLVERLGTQAAAELWPALAFTLGWIDADDAELRGAAAAPGALRAMASRGVGEALRLLAERTPIALVLDDGQFADEATLDALEYATRSETGARLWVCVLARPALARARPSLGRRAAHQVRVTLAPLAEEEAAALLRRLLAPADVPRDVLRELYERTAGVPLLMIELASGLKRRGVLKKRDRGEGWYVATDELDRLPESPLIEWLSRGELEALPAELAAHARLVALLGGEVELTELAAVLARLDRAGAGADFPLDAGVGARRLIAASVLLEPQPGTLQFRHALLREAVVEATPPQVAARIHRAAFEHYAAAGDGLDPDKRLARLAFQAARCGEARAAAAACLQLAERARARHAYLESEQMFDRALSHLGEAARAERLEAHHGRGRARHRLSRLEDACADFRAARELAVELDDRARRIELLLDEAEVLDWRDEWQRSRELVEEARALAGADGGGATSSPLLEARLTLAEGRSLFRFSRGVEACALLERAAEAAAALGDAGYETFAIALVLLGYELPGMGRLDEAARAFDRVIPAARQRGDLWHLAAALNNRYRLWLAHGERERLVADLEQVGRIGRELAFDRMEWFAHFNLGEALLRLDDLDAALAHATTAAEIDDRTQGESGRPTGRLLMARIQAFRGDKSGGRRLFQTLRAQQNRARLQGQSEAELVPSDAVLLAMCDLATRRAEPEEWQALVARARAEAGPAELAEVLEVWGVSALRAGDTASAAEALRLAAAEGEAMPAPMRARVARELAEAER